MLWPKTLPSLDVNTDLLQRLGRSEPACYWPLPAGSAADWPRPRLCWSPPLAPAPLRGRGAGRSTGTPSGGHLVLLQYYPLYYYNITPRVITVRPTSCVVRSVLQILARKKAPSLSCESMTRERGETDRQTDTDGRRGGRRGEEVPGGRRGGTRGDRLSLTRSEPQARG